MRDRPTVLPLTLEDSLIMEDIRRRWRYPLNHWYQHYDREDFLVMRQAQVHPLCVLHWREGLDHIILLRGPPTGERLEWLE